MMIGLGAALLAIGGLGGGYLATQGGQSLSVLTLRSDVHAGHQITATDLATTQISGGTGLHMIRADQASTVVGRYAASDLASGSLLSLAATVDQLTPTAGQSLVGVALKPTQMPATGLRQGDTVRLVVGSAAGAAPAGAQDQKPGRAWAVQVSSASGSVNQDGSVTVDVSVASADATDLAAASSAGTMVAVLDPQKGR